MNRPWLTGIVRVVVVVSLLAGFSALQASAAEYRIGTGDVLDVSFWQDPDLNVQIAVGLDGKITLDIIGQIQAAGRTTEELQNDIVLKMSRLKENISQAVVRVAVYNHNYVFVIGQVNTPGKLAFEEIPDLWTLINEAGGVGEMGDLSRVTIIRGGDDAGKIETVNLAKAIAEGKLDQLPKVRREDTIEIPRTPGQVLATEVGQAADKRNLIYVIGAVTTPGPIKYEEGIDVFEALALAGGPTSEADLKKTQLILKDGRFAQTVRFDLEKYSQTGRPARYIMQKEDMFVVPAQHPGFFSGGVGMVATAVGVVATVALLIRGR